MSQGEFILFILGIIIVIVFLGRYAIIESQRAEQHKKFIKNMNEHGKKLKEFMQFNRGVYIEGCPVGCDFDVADDYSLGKFEKQYGELVI